MNDLIKRSDAIGAITNHCENECYYRVDSWCPQCQREEFEEAIKAVPSVDIPHGDDWEAYSERLWKNAYERGKADRPQGGRVMNLCEAIEIICNDYCKYPGIESGNKLADICDKCPMNKCEDLRWADCKTEQPERNE